MKTLSSLAAMFLSIIRSVIFESSDSFRRLLQMLLLTLRRCLARLQLDHHSKTRDPSHCTPIRRPEFNRPDPLIYSQSYLMSLGLGVTWNNPDITLQKVTGPLTPNAPPDPGLAVSSWTLEPDTEYDVVARIWNGSPHAPVVGMPVHFAVHSFGIGASVTPIGSATVSLGVKGGPGCPAYARARWRTPAEGHHCITATLEWFDDLNPANNVGQENTTIAKAASPARFKFVLGNRWTRRQRFRFEADAYTLPDAPACRVVDREREAAARRAAREKRVFAREPIVAGRPETFPPPEVDARHLRRNHPLPAGWSISFVPPEPVLEPGAEEEIEVIVVPPDDFNGSRRLNVAAFGEGGLAGGVTLTVEKD